MPDEPSSSEYGYISDIAGWIHSNPGRGNELPIFVTRSYTSALDSAIDRWCCSATSYTQSRADTERSHGDDLWYYNGERPGIGSIIIDSPAGIARGFRNAIAAADSVLVVPNPEVSAVRDADRVVGILEAEEKGSPALIINRLNPALVKNNDMLSAEDVLDLLGIRLIRPLSSSLKII